MSIHSLPPFLLDFIKSSDSYSCNLCSFSFDYSSYQLLFYFILNIFLYISSVYVS